MLWHMYILEDNFGGWHVGLVSPIIIENTFVLHTGMDTNLELIFLCGYGGLEKYFIVIIKSKQPSMYCMLEKNLGMEPVFL